MGSETDIVDGITRYQSYTVGTAKDYRGIVNDDSPGSMMGAIWTSVKDANNCYKDYGNAKIDFEFKDEY